MNDAASAALAPQASLQHVANVPEHPPPSSRLMSCAHIANRQLSRIIGAREDPPAPRSTISSSRILSLGLLIYDYGHMVHQTATAEIMSAIDMVAGQSTEAA